MNRGRVVLGTMLIVALAMAGFAWTFQLSRGRRCAALWGGERGLLIKASPRAELWLLEPAANDRSAPNAVLEVDDRRWAVKRTIDLASRPEQAVLRSVLLFDASFDWDHEPGPNDTWTAAIVFADDRLTTTILVAADTGTLRLLEEPRSVRFHERTRQSWRKLISRWTEKSGRQED